MTTIWRVASATRGGATTTTDHDTYARAEADRARCVRDGRVAYLYPIELLEEA